MLELLDMRLSAIGRFVEEQSIDFSSLKEFIQVDGQNNNTGGSSGAAKTTLFNALDYLLGLNDLPSTILQSRYTEEQLSVSGSFLWDGKPVSITRGKKLKVNVDGRVVEGSSALAEEAIDGILGMPRKIFRKLLHKRQKEGGFFLDFTPQKMHEFLIDCLNLAEYRAKDATMDARIKDLILSKSMEETFLNGQEVGLDATAAAIASLGSAPTRNMDQETVLGLKKKMDEAEGALKLALETQAKLLADLELERPKTAVIPFDRTALELHAKTKEDLNAKLNAIAQAEKDRITKVKEWISINNSAIKDNDALQAAQKLAHAEALVAADEIKQIRANSCPTCKQQWTEGKNKETELLKKIAELKVVMDKGAQAYQDRYVLDKNTEGLNNDLTARIHPDVPTINAAIADAAALHLAEKLKEDADIERQNSANNAENEKFSLKERAVRARWDAEVMQARGTLDISRRVFDNAVNIIKSFNETSVRYQKNFDDLKSREAKFTNKIAEVKNTIVEIAAELVLAEEAKKAIKMFLSVSFDEALEAIGTKATEIIRCIPNMKNGTIQFDGTKETKDGKIKEEVNAVIGMDGEESVPIKSLSGGERSAVDIAVDLAVIDFIETKSGKGINLFILDEPFTGLGPVEIEMALEVLKNSNTNKKIVIVDHNSEVKQMVQNRLVVVRDGLTSRIEKEANV